MNGIIGDKMDMTWNEIINGMQVVYGITTTSNEKFNVKEIEAYLEYLYEKWEERFALRDFIYERMSNERK